MSIKQVRTLTGWLAISLALFSLVPSIVPGALSIFGLMLALTALLISIVSVKTAGKRYFSVTLAIVVIGVLFVNDGLRLWSPLAMAGELRLTLYGISGLTIIGCIVFLYASSSDEKQL